MVPRMMSPLEAFPTGTTSDVRSLSQEVIRRVPRCQQDPVHMAVLQVARLGENDRVPEVDIHLDQFASKLGRQMQVGRGKDGWTPVQEVALLKVVAGDSLVPRKHRVLRRLKPTFVQGLLLLVGLRPPRLNEERRQFVRFANDEPR
jgi:hypothetical protein